MTESAGMLKRRLAAAAVLLPAAVAWALLAPLPVFAGIGAVLLLAGAWEWAALAGLDGAGSRVGYLLAALGLSALGWWVLAHPETVAGLLGAFLAFWILLAIELRYAPRQPPRSWRLLEGLVVLVPAWFAVVVVRRGPGGPGLVLALLGIVWAADAAAYFVGRAWGRHRLSPAISPGKTWEGLAGGLLGGAAAGAIASLWCPVPIAVLVPLALATALFSVVGDLAESRLKRAGGAKDSGHLIPGHGGLLDRIDSLCAAAPAFALGLQVWAAR